MGGRSSSLGGLLVLRTGCWPGRCSICSLIGGKGTLHLRIKAISLGSYTKLVALVGLSTGIVIGLLVAVASVLGGEATLHLGSMTIRGLWAVLIGLPLSALFLSLTGAMVAVLTYLPFRGILRLARGLDLDVQAEDEGTDRQSAGNDTESGDGNVSREEASSTGDGLVMIKPPIVVYNWGDVSVENTVEEAEQSLEATHVDDGEYLVFDSEGRILDVTSDGGNSVIIRPTTDARFTAQLRHMLTWFLSRAEGAKQLQRNASIEEMIRAVQLLGRK